MDQRDHKDLWITPSWPTSCVNTRLFVAPEARGLGLGSLLVAAVVAVVAERAARGLRPLLDVVTKDTAAIGLYERLGWTRFGTVTHPFGPGGTTDAYGHVRRSPSDGRMPR